jgi:RNA polymerase sigma-70 factor (ECF subfamily)
MDQDSAVAIFRKEGFGVTGTGDNASRGVREAARTSLEDLLAHRESVFRICLGFSRNYAEAEDLAQDVYVRAYQNLDRLRNPLQAREWLLRIAKNACLDRLKIDRGRERILKGSAPAGLSPALETEAEADDELIRIKSAVRNLPAKLASVLILRAYGRLSYGEIGDALGLRPGTVMSRLNRARRRLAAALKEMSR